MDFNIILLLGSNLSSGFYPSHIPTKTGHALLLSSKNRRKYYLFLKMTNFGMS
jgi:hypothetical protein